MSEPEAHRQSKIPFAWLIDWCRRQWRHAAVVLLVLVAVLLVVRAVANLWVGHQLNEEVARLEKIYGRLDMASLAPPPVPPGENRARVVRAAASLLIVGDTEAATLNRFTQRFVPLPPVEDLRRVVEENQFAMQVAKQGRRRPRSNWEIDYAHDDNFPRLLGVRQLGAVLALSCRFETDAGRADGAAEAAVAGLAEAASLRQEPNLLIQLIRIAVAKEQFECVRDLLARGEPSAARLSDLAGALAENRTSHGFRAAFVGELKFLNHRFGQMERGNVGDYVGVTPSPVWAGPMSWLCRPLIRYGHLRALRTAARVIQMESEPAPARRAAIADAARQGRGLRWWQFVRRFDLSLFTPGLMRAADSGYENLSVLNAAELAVALRRFRLDRGAYPDALADLTPRYLAQVPIDPFTDRPPEYVRQGAGFELRVHGTPDTASELLEWKIPR